MATRRGSKLSLKAMTWLMATSAVPAAMPLPSHAASLEIEYAELAAAVTRLMAGRRVHVAPIATDDAAVGNSRIRLQIKPWHGPSSGEFAWPAPAVRVAGGSYRITPRGSFEVAITATAIAAGLRLVLEATGAMLSLTLGCAEGLCPPAAVLPHLVWQKPTLTLDARVGPDGRTIALRIFGIGGSVRLECPPGWLVERTGCELLAGLLAPELLRRMASYTPSTADAQPDRSIPIAALPVANVLNPAAIELLALTSDATGVRVSFCLSAECPERVEGHPPRAASPPLP